GISFPPGNAPSMTDADIADIIAAYAESAACAKEAGFDGIELHAAHGYLIDQFFWEKTNLRSDRWGGDLAAGGRFGVGVTRACRAAVGPDYPIALRFSQWKLSDYAASLVQTPEELSRFLA